MSRPSLTALAAVLALSAPPAALAQPAEKKPEAAASKDAGKDLDWAKAPVAEQAKTTVHTVNLGGKPFRYRATAGTLTIRDNDGKPTASVFYTAYTADADGTAAARRPVTFFYNGGPGSSSLWLHMGSFGPVRVETGDPETMKPAPFTVGPNPDTLIDKTDMVFIDMIGAGYSRPLGETKGAAFWGVDQDVDAFARTIQRYVTINNRWNSPKVLFGESYGTLRSGALANELQDRGMYLNGVVLFSSIMNYGVRQPGFDQNYLTLFPSYAATAWYHNRVQDRPADVAAFIEEARQFTRGPYASALAKGDTITAAERAQAAQQMSRFTGLSPAFIEQSNLRVDLGRFRKELLRGQRLTIGRLDSRYTGVDADAGGESPEFDASSTAVTGAFAGAVRDYLSGELGYKTDLDYRLSAREENGWTWDWKHRSPAGMQTTPNTAVDLSAAIRNNPHLKVLSMNGWYDMATPFFGAEFDISHMMLEPAQRRNVTFTYYPAGHMIYLNPDARKTMRADLGRWYDEMGR